MLIFAFKSCKTFFQLQKKILKLKIKNRNNINNNNK